MLREVLHPRAHELIRRVRRVPGRVRDSRPDPHRPDAQITAAKAKGDTTGAADLQKKLDAATSLRTTMQSGETLSGLLLTSTGSASSATSPAWPGNVLYGLGAIMVVISIAGFVHA